MILLLDLRTAFECVPSCAVNSVSTLVASILVSCLDKDCPYKASHPHAFNSTYWDIRLHSPVH